jgi:predicted membrane channel-forming protein YqfA (hemolysin III family)
LCQQLYNHTNRLALAAIFGIALGILATILEASRTFAVPALTIVVCGFSLVISNDLLRRVSHFVGVMLCWTCVMYNFGGVFGEFKEEFYKDEGIPRSVIRLVHRFYWLLTSVAFCVMEVDRINGRSTISEAEELRQGYLD